MPLKKEKKLHPISESGYEAMMRAT